ncbi:hypothetical protein K525DRAFT_258731 [Schizophyllum commune Loenen D]|nr:hypothetical protein K525DRAFT_258731 [Schizophyllum commune Loenen D]
MRATAVRSLEVIKKSVLENGVRVIPRIQPLTRATREPTVLELLQERRKAAGAQWPANIRLEPAVPKTALVDVERHARRKLKLLTRER